MPSQRRAAEPASLRQSHPRASHVCPREPQRILHCEVCAYRHSHRPYHASTDGSCTHCDHAPTFAAHSHRHTRIPRHTAVLGLACSALGACSNCIRPALLPILLTLGTSGPPPHSRPAGSRPACLACIRTALPFLATPGLRSNPPYPSSCCHRFRAPSLTRGGRAGGTSASAPSSAACKSTACSNVDACEC